MDALFVEKQKTGDNMKKAFDFWIEHLFCKKTNLFYDHLYDLSKDGATKFLPTIESIKRQQPNPNGWSTGMEDSVLCGSMMLDVVLKMYKIAPSENLRQIAKGCISYNPLLQVYNVFAKENLSFLVKLNPKV